MNIELPDVYQDDYFNLTKDLQYAVPPIRTKYIFWPSEASITINYNRRTLNMGHCSRATYYAFQRYNYSNLPPENFYTIIKEGKLLELIEVEKLKARARRDPSITLYEKLSFKNININNYTFTMSFTFDNVLVKNGTPYIVEYKTVSDYYSVNKYIKNTFIPRAEYLLQVGLYLYLSRYCLDDQLLNKIREAWLIVLDRGVEMYSKRGKKYVVSLDINNDKHYIVVNGYRTYLNIEGIFEKYEYIKNCIEKNICPERDYKLVYSEEDIITLRRFHIIDDNTDQKKIDQIKLAGDFQCRYCFYKDICYNKVQPLVVTNMEPNDIIEDSVNDIVITL